LGLPASVWVRGQWEEEESRKEDVVSRKSGRKRWRAVRFRLFWIRREEGARKKVARGQNSFQEQANRVTRKREKKRKKRRRRRIRVRSKRGGKSRGVFCM
jgi:hypothetical protein